MKHYYYLIEYYNPLWLAWCVYQGGLVYSTRKEARKAKVEAKTNKFFNEIPSITLKFRIVKRTVENKVIY